MNKILMAATGVAALLLSSCGSGDDRFPGFEKTETGIYYQLHKEGDETKTLNEGDVIFISQVMYTDTDSLLFDSRKMDPAQGPYAVKIGKPVYPGDMFDAIKMMHVGDSMTFCLNAKEMWDKAYKQPLPAWMDSTSYLKYSIKVDSVYGKEKVAEIEKQQEEMYKKQMAMQEEMMKQYQVLEDSLMKVCLKKHKVSVKPTETGLYFIEVAKGKGDKVKMGDKVAVEYEGTLPDGTIFDGSKGAPEPLTFKVGEMPVIAAWNEALMKMSLGSKVKIVCPSKLGYGPQGNGPIPPYSPLVFEMELVGLNDVKAK